MRIITLNTWGGRAGKEKQLAFFDREKDTTDIFCLQEIWSAPYEHLDGVSAGGRKINHEEVMTQGLQEITAHLPGHTPFFAPHYQDNYGLLIFTRKSLEISEQGELFVHRENRYSVPEGDIGNHARNIQYVTVMVNDTLLTVVNFHGLWNGKGKTDTPERLAQSDKIVAFFNTLKTPVVFCGDFNLLPDTESIGRFETFGLRNLIKEYGVQTTRSSYYSKPEKFADYMFVSPEVTVKDFHVLSDEVSDHLPLQLDILV